MYDIHLLLCASSRTTSYQDFQFCLTVGTHVCAPVRAGGGEGAAALHEPYAGGQSGLCSVPLVGLWRQEVPGRAGTPGRPAAGGTHTYVHTLYTDKETDRLIRSWTNTDHLFISFHMSSIDCCNRQISV